MLAGRRSRRGSRPSARRSRTRIRRARFSPKHANFVENTGAASTADVLALMGEGRRRVLESFGVALEPEVQLLGDLRFPW